jgi:hypothetical protein
MSGVGLRRLFPSDLSDEHLTMLNRAVHLAPDATIERWLEWIVGGMMALYEFTGGPIGIVGLVRRPDCIWVELATGQGLAAISKDMVRLLRTVPEVGDLPLMMLVSDPRLERLYARRGAKRLGTLMRYEGG